MTLLYTGKMSYRPNVDAMLWFREAILPRIWQACPRARLVIAGRDPVPELIEMQERRIEVTGTVRDIRPYFERSTVYVVPLRTGGGTRLKIPEAMAMARPIVSTSFGCAGLPVTAEEDIIVADEPADFAAAVVQLLQDEEKRSRLAERARETAERRMDWAASRERLLHAYELAIRHHRTSRQ
jgi:glycosyltransferase involved in cell wall biosynthesis